MIRNFKALGLAVMGVLALSAVAASGAQAELTKFTSSEGYPVTLSGENAGVSSVALSIAGGVRTVSCGKVGLSKVLAAETATLEGLTAKYEECTGNGETTATIDMTGCTYTLATFNTRPSSGAGNATVSIACPAGTAIDIRIYSKGKEHIEANELCRYRIPAQMLTGLLDWHNHNTGTTTEDLEFTTNFLVAQIVERVKGTLVACGLGTTDATYSGNVTVTGSASGVHRKLMIG